MKNILKTYALHKKFGLHSALKDLNITIPKSSVYAILGPNGSGKSTTLGILLKALRPDAGYLFLRTGALLIWLKSLLPLREVP